MKKSLVALAVLAAAGAASAQSSVPLFGIVDATLAHGNGSGAGSSDMTRLTHSGYNSSRLGFRGTEDLGGGMAASFWLEAGVSNDDGTGQPSNTNNQATGNAPAGAAGGQGLTFARRSTVSLSGGWGEVRLGRDYTSTFRNIGSFDPFGYNGVGTTVIAARSIPGTASVVQVRVSNSIGYFLPAKLGGFYGQAQYYLGENAQTGAATEDDGKGWNFRIGYAAGPFNIALAHNNLNLAAGDIKTTNIGGQWDFGVAKLLANYQRDRQSGVASGRGGLIGGLIPVGAGEVRLSYSVYKVDNNAAAALDPRARKMAIGYVHNLSKRTALYASYARVKNSGGSALGLNGAVTAANNSSSGYDFGVRHSF